MTEFEMYLFSQGARIHSISGMVNEQEHYDGQLCLGLT